MEREIIQNNLKLENDRWIPAEPLKYQYPFWLKFIPIKFLRDMIEKYFWYRE